MDGRGAVFRPPFLLAFALIFIAGAGTGAVFRAVLLQAGYTGPGVWSYAFLRLLSIVYLWTMVCALALQHLLSIRLMPSGMRGRTFWGTAKTVEWADIGAVRRTGFWPFRFLRVYAITGGPPLWVPRFLKHHPALREQLADLVDADHPVRAEFEASGSERT